MNQIEGLYQRIVGAITIWAGRRYLRKRADELRGPVLTGAAVTAGVVVLGAVAVTAQHRRSRLPTV